MKFSKPDSDRPTAPEPSGEAGPAPVEDKRVAARRRFLKIGAGGSAAVVVTVTHRRAYAAKKGAVASACASLQTPDLGKITGKKALTTSAQGGFENLICRNKPPGPNDPPIGNCTKDGKDSKWSTSGSTYTRIQLVKSGELDKGCGDINTTLWEGNKYRLYQDGYCPITYQNGVLDYDTTAKFWAYMKNDGKPTEKLGESKDGLLYEFPCTL